MTYRIEFTSAARKQFKRLSRETQRRLDVHILSLASNPFPSGVQKLAGGPALFRIRVSDYRVIYTVERGALVIVIVRVGHRREIYRGL